LPITLIDMKTEKAASVLLALSGIPFTEVSKEVFKVETQYGATVYYPKHAKWIHRGKTRKGDLQAFSQWVRPMLIEEV